MVHQVHLPLLLEHDDPGHFGTVVAAELRSAAGGQHRDTDQEKDSDKAHLLSLGTFCLLLGRNLPDFADSA